MSSLVGPSRRTKQCRSMSVTQSGQDDLPPPKRLRRFPTVKAPTVWARNVLNKRLRRVDPDPDAGCTLCSLMFSREGLRRLNSPDGFRHLTRVELFDSVNSEQGCPSCFLIAKSIEGQTMSSDRIPLIFRNRRAVGKATNEDDPTLNVLEGYLGQDGPITCIYPYAESYDPMATLIPRRPLERNVESPEVLNKAKEHYEQCANHPQCSYSFRDAVLPSRVLDVGTNDAPSLQLLLNDEDESMEYVTLSYCWGGPQKKVLLQNTLEKMSSKDGLREDTLEQSVRDAVKVTRMLGFRYLWVDALCIIQDCDKDKAREIERMSAIYRNSAITIAAATSRRATDGFLGQKNTYLPEERVTVNGPSGKGTVYLRSRPHVPWHTLDERGWVLQEFMFPSRLLIFSEYELLWQCKELALQSVTGGSEALEYLQSLEVLPWTSFSVDDAALYGNNDEEKMYLWRTVVEQYTRRWLTNTDDRLSALRGITKELEVLWEESSYFGLWERWFVGLLAWYKPKGAPEEERELHRSNRAPSWSWASLNRQVMYTEMFQKEYSKLKGPGMLGTIAPAYVVLRCRMMKADDIGTTQPDEDGDMISSGCDEFPDLDGAAFWEEVKEREVQILLLGMIKREGKKLGVGLMVVDSGEDFYQRVGMAEFEYLDAWDGVRYQEIILK